VQPAGLSAWVGGDLWVVGVIVLDAAAVCLVRAR